MPGICNLPASRSAFGWGQQDPASCRHWGSSPSSAWDGRNHLSLVSRPSVGLSCPPKVQRPSYFHSLESLVLAAPPASTGTVSLSAAYDQPVTQVLSASVFQMGKLRLGGTGIHPKSRKQSGRCKLRRHLNAVKRTSIKRTYCAFLHVCTCASPMRDIDISTPPRGLFCGSTQPATPTKGT